MRRFFNTIKTGLVLTGIFTGAFVAMGGIGMYTEGNILGILGIPLGCMIAAISVEYS